MKTILKSIAAVLLVTAASFGQTILTNTTLSAAITKLKAQQLVVASATGITAPTVTSTIDLYIDKELMTVEAISGTTVTVIRGQGGTTATYHASGATVFVGPPQAFFVGSADVAGVGGGIPPLAGGSCTRANVAYLPAINVATGVKSDCLGGVWVSGFDTAQTEYRLSFPPPGNTAYTSINTNGTAVGATTLYCMEANLPYNKMLTGIGVLNGTTVTANARYVVLYDAGGTALANSALAGQASVTASIYEAYAFTKTFFAVGPAKYFACLQDNAVGSTTVRMAVTGTNDNFLTKGQTSATFGTVPTLTVPTSFTTAVGPYVYLY